jgi:hypothetical protein
MEKKMKTENFNMVMAALIAVIFLVPTGCASTGTDAAKGGVAKQLAADLNAVKSGSAEVNGGTVTLAGDIRLETALTIPVGVTLEVPIAAIQSITRYPFKFSAK